MAYKAASTQTEDIMAAYQTSDARHHWATYLWAAGQHDNLKAVRCSTVRCSKVRSSFSAPRGPTNGMLLHWRRWVRVSAGPLTGPLQE